METGTDPFPSAKADQTELKLTKMPYPYPIRRLKVPVDDRSFVKLCECGSVEDDNGNGATHGDVAQGSRCCSVCVRLKCAFDGWFWFVRRTLAERQGYYTGVIQGIFHSLWWEWAFYHLCQLWRRSELSARVRSVERLMRKRDAESI